MRYEVRVIPGAKKTGVTPQDDGSLKVCVSAPAQEGRANAAVIEVLAKHLGVPKRALTIIRGETSRRKLVEVRQV